MKVLIVDDMATTRVVLKTFLKQLGQVLEASGGIPALHLCAEQKFDVIISDLNMKDMSGLSLLQRLNDQGVLEQTRFYLVSTDPLSPEDIAELKNIGLSGYVRKPFVKEDIIGIVRGEND